MNNRIRLAKGSASAIGNSQSIIPDGVPVFNTTENKLYIGQNNKTLAQLYSEGGIVATQAQYASADTSKGTIEERLTRLGFRQGSIQLNTGFYASTNVLYRQGNYVIGKLQLTGEKQFTITTGEASGELIGMWPSDFKPKETTNQGSSFTIKGAIPINSTGGVIQAAVSKTFGQVILTYTFPAAPQNNSYTITISDRCIYFGYEAEPLV